VEVVNRVVGHVKVDDVVNGAREVKAAGSQVCGHHDSRRTLTTAVSKVGCRRSRQTGCRSSALSCEEASGDVELKILMAFSCRAVSCVCAHQPCIALSKVSNF